MKHIKLFEQFITEKKKRSDWSPEEATEWADRYRKFIGKKIDAEKFIKADELIKDIRYNRKVKNNLKGCWWRLVGVEVKTSKAVASYPYNVVSEVFFVFESPWAYSPYEDIKDEWKGVPFKITANSAWDPAYHNRVIDKQWIYQQNPEKYLASKKYNTTSWHVMDMDFKKEIKAIDMMFGLTPHPMNWEAPKEGTRINTYTPNS